MTSFISASDSRENDGIVPRPFVNTSRIPSRLSLTSVSGGSKGRFPIRLGPWQAVQFMS
jgi:hypothetical protein